MAVPNIFATATSSIPLSQLDTNFATAITLGSTGLYLGNTTTSVAGLTLTGSAFNGTVGATTPSTGAFTTLSATGTLSGGTSGTGYSFNGSAPATSLTLDSAGSLGVGGTPVNARKLLVSTASQTDISINAGSSAYGQLLFGYTGADNKGIVAYNNSDNSMQFYTNATERMRLNSTGALVLAGGTTAANGIGIAFPATQSASTDANTLDDYEEGTWTPAISGTTSASGQTYSIQAGTYTKVGNVCTITGQIVLSNKGTITGFPIITGIPFNRGGSDQGRVYCFVYFENMATSVYYVSANFDDSARLVLIKSTAVSTSVTLFASGNTDLANNTTLNFALTYRTT